jgi:hypothetical protein
MATSPPDKWITDFGQKVDLTARLREILLNYPEGTSILKELVQVRVSRQAVCSGAPPALKHLSSSSITCACLSVLRCAACCRTLMTQRRPQCGLCWTTTSTVQVRRACWHACMQQQRSAPGLKFCYIPPLLLHAGSLLSPQLAQFQGPALLAYNDGVFNEKASVPAAACSSAQTQVYVCLLLRGSSTCRTARILLLGCVGWRHCRMPRVLPSATAPPNFVLVFPCLQDFESFSRIGDSKKREQAGKTGRFGWVLAACKQFRLRHATHKPHCRQHSRALAATARRLVMLVC